MRWGLAIVLACAASAARADDAKAPWVVGVSEEAKTAAKQLLAEGNTLFLQHDYAGALDRYRRAIARWDHPAIRFNIVRCLIQLDRPAEASENLELALKYGAAPLEENVFAEAKAYEKLLASQVGEVEVLCDQAGVTVTLDAQELVTCPGAKSRRVAPGKHIVVGTKDGFIPQSHDVLVLGGAHEKVAVALAPIGTGGEIVHRWPAWVPWVVFGGGLGVVGAGVLLEGVASARMSDYDRALVRDCAGTGCGPGHPVPAADQQLESSARMYSAIGVATLSVGALAAITGGVMLYMNRGRTVYRNVEVVPLRGGGAVTFSLRY